MIRKILKRILLVRKVLKRILSLITTWLTDMSSLICLETTVLNELPTFSLSVTSAHQLTCWFKLKHTSETPKDSKSTAENDHGPSLVHQDHWPTSGRGDRTTEDLIESQRQRFTKMWNQHWRVDCSFFLGLFLLTPLTLSQGPLDKEIWCSTFSSSN